MIGEVPPGNPRETKGDMRKLIEEMRNDPNRVRSIYVEPKVLELLQAVYVDAETIVPDYTLYRYQRGAVRRYFRIEPDAVFWYVGGTSVVSAVTPKGDHLMKWMFAQGSIEAANAVRDNRADYGTLMHIEYTKFLRDGTYNLDAVPKVIAEYAKERWLQAGEVEGWEQELQKGMLALTQFTADREVKPIAIELPVYSDALGIATVIDLVTTMKKTDKGKKVVGLGDWKSSRSGFHDGTAQQVGLNSLIFQERFKEKKWKPEYLFNYRPKDWRGTTPTYHIQDRTGDEKAQPEFVKSLADFAMRNLERAPGKALRISGTITAGEAPETQARELDPVELVREGQAE